MRLSTLVIFLLTMGLTCAQDPVISLDITTKDEDSGKKLSTATIVIKSGGSVFVTKTSASNGKVAPIDLPLGQNYTVYIQKEGYVTKVATIDGHYDYMEDLPPFIPFPVQTALFRSVDGVDFQWLETTPMIKFELDQYGNQAWDRAYTAEMLKKIKKLKEEMANKKEEIEENEAEFEALIADADKAFAANSYEDARSKYVAALRLKPAELHPSDQISLIDDILKKLKEEEDAAKKLEQDYKKAIDDGDVAFISNNWNGAMASYEVALAIKDEAYPRERIAKLKIKIAELAEAEEKDKLFNELIAQGDELGSKKEYDAAVSKYNEAIKVKPDPNITQKILDLRGQQEDEIKNQALIEQYKKKITDADIAFEAKNWEVAKATYRDAIKLKGDETYPQLQLAEIDRLKKEEVNKEVNGEYQKVIAKADGLRDKDMLDEAIATYEQAKGIKLGENYPQEQIDRIKELKEQRKKELTNKDTFDRKYEDLISSADMAFGSKNYSTALSDYQEALNMKPNEAHPQDKIRDIEAIFAQIEAESALDVKYKTAVDRADNLFNAGSYGGAKSAYQEALDLKGSEQYPKDRLLLCNKKMQEPSTEDLEKEYQKILATAQKNFDEKNYDSAIDYYKRAKGIRPSETLPQQRIDEINQLLEEQLSSNSKRDPFDKLIQQADTYYERKEWKDALQVYMDALDLFHEQYPLDQVEKCREFIKTTGRTGDEAYNKLIERADEHFDMTNYDKAEELYLRAVGLKPSDEHPKDRLKEIDKILNPPKKQIAGSQDLIDYGSVVNKRPIDIEAMLNEAKEQAKEYDIQRVYQQREDSEKALSEWEEDGENDRFETKERLEEMGVDLSEVKWNGEMGRQEAHEQVGDWQEEVDLKVSERQIMQENDIQYQNKRLEAMHIETQENVIDTDEQRKQYLVDVEKIKIERSEKIESNRTAQNEVIQHDKKEIDIIVEGHVSSNINNDVARQNTIVEVEDMEIMNINSTNEVAWNQEDQIMKMKEETELIIDDIIGNNLDRDIVRTDHLEIVEDMNIVYYQQRSNNVQNQSDKISDAKDHTERMLTDIQESSLESDNKRQETEAIVEGVIVANHDRERKSAEEQYNKVVDARDHAEQMKIDADNNKWENDQPRVETESLIEAKQVEINERISSWGNTQTDIAMSTDKKIEELETKTENHKSEMNANREGYEDAIEGVKEDLSDYSSSLKNENIDNAFDVKEHTEEMQDKREEFFQEMDKNSNEQTDKNMVAIDEHKEHLGDAKERTDDALIESEKVVEQLKDIDVKSITPEMENELGQKFPEGVTEESFAINDSNGLLKAYMIRRVVVREGVGQVYEKTQTRYGAITYTRNGEGISEYQWDDETSSANTLRN